jgi:hypothetical protein
MGQANMDQEKMSKSNVVGVTLNVQRVGFTNLKGSIIITRPYSVHMATWSLSNARQEDWGCARYATAILLPGPVTASGALNPQMHHRCAGFQVHG